MIRKISSESAWGGRATTTSNVSNSSATEALSSQFSTFEPFPRLPFELRDRIWELSLPGSRFIYVQTEVGEIWLSKPVRGLGSLSGTKSAHRFEHVWTRKTPVPAILQICHESRRVGLKHYELAFDSNERPCKEDLPAIIKPRRSRGRSFDEFVFPFESKAMIYVDLKKDLIITSHRRSGWRRSSSALRSAEDVRFEKMPVWNMGFKLAIFRKLVPRSVFERIRIFVATYAFGIHELFPGRYGMGLGSMEPVVAILNPFVRRDGGEGDDDEENFGTNCNRDYINRLKAHWRGVPENEREGRVSKAFRRVSMEKLKAEWEDGTLFECEMLKEGY